MTKEEVLQKVNDYCTEKQYTTATLTDTFKTKFVDHFFEANKEGDINDESVVKNLKFALNTAFSSASDIATLKGTEYTTKEANLNKTISELQEKLKKQQPTQQQQQQQEDEFKLPKEVQDQLDELKKYKDDKTKQEKLAEILKLAKGGIRDNLHASFDSFASDYAVKLDVDAKVQADTLVTRFKEIFKDTISDIAPKSPVTKKQDEEFVNSLPKIEIS